MLFFFMYRLMSGLDIPVPINHSATVRAPVCWIPFSMILPVRVE